MKKLFFTLVCAVLLASCSASTSDIANEAKMLFNSNSDGTGIIATNVTLTKVSDNSYKGIITLSNGSETEDYTIIVNYDGETIMYEIPDLQ